MSTDYVDSIEKANESLKVDLCDFLRDLADRVKADATATGTFEASVPEDITVRPSVLATALNDIAEQL